MRDIILSGQIPEKKLVEDIIGPRPNKPLFDLKNGYNVKTELAPHIEKADGYVVLPGADPLLTTSLLIGYQFQNPEVRGKPLVIYSPDEQPSPYVKMIRSLRSRGFVHQPEEQFYTIAKTVEEIPQKLESGFGVHSGPKVDGHEDDPEYHKFVDQINREGASKPKPKHSVAVFCSASTKDPHYLELARKTGHLIADRGMGMVFGGSNVSMMGEVAAGVHDRGGHVTGVTIPLFFGKEILPNKDTVHIDNLRIVSDIYERMHDMVKQSDALVVLPGGIGTVQEMLAVMKMREREPELAKHPVVLFNDGGFWDELKEVMEDYGYKAGKHFHVVSNHQELDKLLDEKIGPAPKRLASGPESKAANNIENGAANDDPAPEKKSGPDPDAAPRRGLRK
jgi:uncharacterized protein (TIGR00730 family)